MSLKYKLVGKIAEEFNTVLSNYMFKAYTAKTFYDMSVDLEKVLLKYFKHSVSQVARVVSVYDRDSCKAEIKIINVETAKYITIEELIDIILADKQYLLK
jgi:hypothetical protein